VIVFDLETDGFLESVTKTHCLNMIDRAAGKRLRYTDYDTYSDGTLVKAAGSLEQGLARLAKAPLLAGQNIIGYDLPVLEKLYGFVPKVPVFDTLIASRVIWTNIIDVDFSLLRSGKLPQEFKDKGYIGSHKLAAWGYRLGMHKGDFDPKDYGFTWATVPFLKEMDDYCAQDCEVTLKWIEKIESKNYSTECLEMEMRVAQIIAQQERNGFPFDVAAAEKLYATLTARKADLDGAVSQAFPPWEVKLPDFIPKRANKKLGYLPGVPVPRSKTEVFNPGSRAHIADRLKDKYGWNPIDFTPKGDPKIDESVLGSLPYPEAKVLTEYLLVTKYAGQVYEGDKGWLRQVKDGRIHGRVNTNGAVTGRMTHSNPNVAQVPKVGSPYGEECRSLFTASEGRVMVGCDAEGLELRMLAHYMATWDGGGYSAAVVEGRKEDETDVHNVNKKAAGLNKRDAAKTFIYALLYGAGDFKIGTVVYDDFTDSQRAAFDKKYPLGSKSRDRGLATLGKNRRAQIMEKLPAFAKLTDAVKKTAKARRQLKGLDGRIIHVRSEHSALNALLQGAGAIVMKKALVILDDAIATHPMLAGNVAFLANVHDEYQMETTPDLAETLGVLAADAIRLAGEHFKLRCPLAGSYDIGRTWADTH
jgi:DNA polymerase I-like protein with 3'-5' exonuclease and polymerase domains